nr:MAG TPA: hypothetical protein [Bacteriophage sp.]
MYYKNKTLPRVSECLNLSIKYMLNFFTLKNKVT